MYRACVLFSCVYVHVSRLYTMVTMVCMCVCVRGHCKRTCRLCKANFYTEFIEWRLARSQRAQERMDFRFPLFFFFFFSFATHSLSLFVLSKTVRYYYWPPPTGPPNSELADLGLLLIIVSRSLRIGYAKRNHYFANRYLYK